MADRAVGEKVIFQSSANIKDPKQKPAEAKPLNV